MLNNLLKEGCEPLIWLKLKWAKRSSVYASKIANNWLRFIANCSYTQTTGTIKSQNCPLKIWILRYFVLIKQCYVSCSLRKNSIAAWFIFSPCLTPLDFPLFSFKFKGHGSEFTIAHGLKETTECWKISTAYYFASRAYMMLYSLCNLKYFALTTD